MKSENIKVERAMFRLNKCLWNMDNKFVSKLSSPTHYKHDANNNKDTKAISKSDENKEISALSDSLKYLHTVYKGNRQLACPINGQKRNLLIKITCDKIGSKIKDFLKVGVVFSKVNGKLRLLSKPERTHGTRHIRCPRGKSVRPALNITSARIIENFKFHLDQCNIQNGFMRRTRQSNAKKKVIFNSKCEQFPCSERGTLKITGMCFLTIGNDVQDGVVFTTVIIGIPNCTTANDTTLISHSTFKRRQFEMINGGNILSYTQKDMLVNYIRDKFSNHEDHVALKVEIISFSQRLSSMFETMALKVSHNHETIVVKVSNAYHSKFIEFLSDIVS